MHVGIVGSRFFNNYQLFEKKILEWEVKNGTITKIISGGCRGTDRLAEIFAKKYGKELFVHNADWNKYGKGAGPKRNTLIVNDANYLIAFPTSNSIGTYDSINKAKNKDIPVTIYNV